MYQIKIKTSKKTNEFLKKFPKEFKKALLNGVRKSIYYAEGEAKKSFGKPNMLHVRSGYLRRSITSNVEDRYNKITASLSSNVVYAGIHEYGGVIRAKHSPYLRFKVDNRWAAVKEVVIPARPFLGPAIEDNLNIIGKIIQDEIEKRINNV